MLPSKAQEFRCVAKSFWQFVEPQSGILHHPLALPQSTPAIRFSPKPYSSIYKHCAISWCVSPPSASEVVYSDYTSIQQSMANTNASRAGSGQTLSNVLPLHGPSREDPRSPVVPLDLQERIINMFFSNHHDSSLPLIMQLPAPKSTQHHALSAVSRHWYRCVAGHKFKHVRVCIVRKDCFVALDWASSIHLSTLLDLIRSRPFIAQCIRYVSISNRATAHPLRFPSRPSSLDTMLVKLCTLIAPSIEVVNFAIQDDGRRSFIRKTSVLLALTTLCSGPQLHTMWCGFAPLPTTCLLAANNLKSLTFYNCYGLSFPDAPTRTAQDGYASAKRLALAAGKASQKSC